MLINPWEFLCKIFFCAKDLNPRRSYVESYVLTTTLPGRSAQQILFQSHSCAEYADDRHAGVLGLGDLRVAESSSTASIYPGYMSMSVRSLPVPVHICPDRHSRYGFWSVTSLTRLWLRARFARAMSLCLKFWVWDWVRG